MDTVWAYRLGHQPYISAAELEAISGQYVEHVDNWALLTTPIDIKHLGGTIMKVRIITQTTKQRTAWIHHAIISSIEFLKEKGNTIKTIGISIRHSPAKPSSLIRIAKQAGAKKVNILTNQLPGIGHWKFTRNWLLFFSINGVVYAGVIDDYSDQEAWRQFDVNLPYGDIKRGVMNLKLALMLNNLAGSPTRVWDPFCGHARTILPAIHRYENVLCSDIDKAVLSEARANIDWFKNRILGDINKPKVDITSYDVQRILPPTIRSFLSKPTTIITEGYLGTNFRTPPRMDDITRQHNIITNIWKDFLKNLEPVSSNIDCIVACIPLYRRTHGDIINTDLINFLHTTQPLGMKHINTHLTYARQNTITAHHIIILRR